MFWCRTCCKSLTGLARLGMACSRHVLLVQILQHAMPSLARPADAQHVLHQNKNGPGCARQLWANMPEYDGCDVGIDEYRCALSAVCCPVIGDPCIRQHSGACRHAFLLMQPALLSIVLTTCTCCFQVCRLTNICTCIWCCLIIDITKPYFSASALQCLKGHTTSVCLFVSFPCDTAEGSAMMPSSSMTPWA